MGSPDIKWYKINIFDFSDPPFTVKGQSNKIYRPLGAKWYLLIAMTHISLVDISSALTAQEIHFEILRPPSNETRPDWKERKHNQLHGFEIFIPLKHMNHVKEGVVQGLYWVIQEKLKTSMTAVAYFLRLFIYCLQVLADTTTWL